MRALTAYFIRMGKNPAEREKKIRRKELQELSFGKEQGGWDPVRVRQGWPWLRADGSSIVTELKMEYLAQMRVGGLM